MSQENNLELEIESLKVQILELEKKNERYSSWIKREVKSQSLRFSKSKTKKFTQDIKDDFLKENIEELIANQIVNYFGDLMLLNAPNWTIEWITTAEVNFFNMKKSPNIDWFSVISGYHKVFDLFIERFITNNFRKYAKKKNQIILRVNDPLEKSLHMIVTKKYIMSTWRLFGLLRLIKEDSQMYDYGRCFKEYLEKYVDLSNILLDDDFMKLFTKLNKTEVLSSKRHSWSISKDETTEARNILIWDFKDKNSIMYKLLETQNVPY